MKEKLKIGIIGCGNIAKKKHMPGLKSQSDKCEMIAFCDTDAERAIDARDIFGAPNAKVYTDYHELLKNEEIDEVHVLTPNVFHCPITLAAFKAGKHVLCEKPMAASAEEAKKMMEAWKKSGKKFTVSYQNRFRNDMRTLKSLCTDNQLGEIYFAKAHAVRRRAVPTWGVFQNKSLQGGGPLIDIGTHALDLVLWCMDNYKPISVQGSVFHKLGGSAEAAEGNKYGKWDTEGFQVEDSAFAFIKMENGAAIFLETSWALNIKDSREAAVTLCGTKAGAEIINHKNSKSYELIINKTVDGKLTEERIFEEEEADDISAAEAKQWLNAIINDSDPLVKPEQAYVVTQILDAVYRSSEEKREIIL